MALQRAGGSGEPFQELSHTDSDLGLSRHDSPVNTFEGFSDPASDPESALSRRRVLLLLRAAAQSLAFSSGGHVVNVLARSRLLAPHAVFTAPPQRGGSSGLGGRADLLGRLLPPGASVVVRCQPSRMGSLPRSVSSATSPLHRRVRLRLGCFARCRPSIRLVVTGCFEIFHQSPRTPCYSISDLGFLHLIWDQSVSLFTDNTTALAYLSMRSSSLNEVAQAILRLCEVNAVRLLPQFIPGRLNILADSFSRGSQVLGSEWTLCREVCQELFRRWPVTIVLFATSLNHHLQVYFPRWWISSLRGRMQCSSIGTTSKPTRSLHLASFSGSSPRFANLGT